MNVSSDIAKATSIHCIVYRFSGLILLVASVINLIVTIHYLSSRLCRKNKRPTNHNLSSIITGMMISSILVIFTGLPLIIIQCFICQPYLSYNVICKIHSFMCFVCGIFNMYIVALISFFRYLIVLDKPNWLNRLLKQHCDWSLILCAILSVSWATPPLFNIGNRYVREGDGYYCSLDWHDSSYESKIFLLCLIIFNYGIPFILLIYSNMHVFCTLRHVLKSCDNSRYLSSSKSFILSLYSNASYQTSSFIYLRKHFSDLRLKETTNRLQRLKADRRYALMTATITLQYLIAWTPYAFFALMSIIKSNPFITTNSFILTLSSLLAKLSLIINPVIWIYTSKIMKA